MPDVLIVCTGYVSVIEVVFFGIKKKNIYIYIYILTSPFFFLLIIIPFHV